MTDSRLPTHVEQFIERLRAGVDFFGCELALADDRLAAPPHAMVLEVHGTKWPTTVSVQQASPSNEQTSPQFRVNAVTQLPGELWPRLRGQEGTINRFATLGALVTNGTSTEVTCQAPLAPHSSEVLAALVATACVHGATSLIQSVDAALAENPGEAGQSEWSDADFEAIHYEHAHLRTGLLGAKTLNFALTAGEVSAELELSATYNNPYFQGGLLSLLRISKQSLGLQNRPLDINALNKAALATDVTPMFGAWCDDGIHLVFATFVPNLLKPVDGIARHLVRWATRRATWIKSLTDQASTS